MLSKLIAHEVLDHMYGLHQDQLTKEDDSNKYLHLPNLMLDGLWTIRYLEISIDQKGQVLNQVSTLKDYNFDLSIVS